MLFCLLYFPLRAVLRIAPAARASGTGTRQGEREDT
jgi:hypothetical protein